MAGVEFYGKGTREIHDMDNGGGTTLGYNVGDEIKQDKRRMGVEVKFSKHIKRMLAWNKEERTKGHTMGCEKRKRYFWRCGMDVNEADKIRNEEKYIIKWARQREGSAEAKRSDLRGVKRIK